MLLTIRKLFIDILVPENQHGLGDTGSDWVAKDLHTGALLIHDNTPSIPKTK